MRREEKHIIMTEKNLEDIISGYHNHKCNYLKTDHISINTKGNSTNINIDCKCGWSFKTKNESIKQAQFAFHIQDVHFEGKLIYNVYSFTI